mgnify:FL=1
MTAKNQDFEMYEGDSKKLVFDTSGVDIADITEVSWSATDNSNKDAKLITKSLTGGGITTDETESTITVTLDSADTEDLSTRGLVHELEIEDTAGNKNTAAVGHMKLIRDIN